MTEKTLPSVFLGNASVNHETAHPQYTPLEIAQTLSALSDDAFDAYVYTREPLQGKIDAVQKRELAERARQSGIEQAQLLQKRFPQKNITEICNALHLTICHHATPQNADRVLYAQFKEPSEITIFTHGIQTAAQFAQREGTLSYLQPHKLESILLAHELYHVIETRNPKIFSASYRLHLWKFGPFSNDSPVLCLSEIASMAFTKTLQQLSCSPYVLDALLLYGYDPVGACLICDEIVSTSDSLKEKKKCD